MARKLYENSYFFFEKIWIWDRKNRFSGPGSLRRPPEAARKGQKNIIFEMNGAFKLPNRAILRGSAASNPRKPLACLDSSGGPKNPQNPPNPAKTPRIFAISPASTWLHVHPEAQCTCVNT